MKYIVYLTINLINYNIYIGQHGIDGDGKDYYLGNGVYGNKPWTYAHPKYPFQYAVKKYGPKNFYRFTLATFDTKEEALQLEKSLVNETFLKRNDIYNIAEGGGKMPDTSKKIYQYSLEGEFITEFGSVREMERKLGFNHSSVQNAVKFKSTSHGYLWSYDKHDSLDISEYCIYNRTRKLYIYNKEKKFVKEVNSIKEAALFINVKITYINKALHNHKKCNGYYISDVYVETFEPVQSTVKIYQYNLDGTFVKEWENEKSVVDYFQLSNIYTLGRAIQRDTPMCGYYWKKSKYDHIEPYKIQKRKVGIFKDGDLIQSYPSVAAFKKEHSSYEWSCLKSGQPTGDNRLIKYLS